jgi:uncharacterized protein (DUF885 family)
MGGDHQMTNDMSELRSDMVAEFKFAGDRDEHMAERIADIENELRIIREQLDAISQTLIKADTTITKVAAEVMPTLDGLMKSPMLKMLLPKGSR